MFGLLLSSVVAATAEPALAYRVQALTEARTDSRPGIALQLSPLGTLAAQLRLLGASLTYRPRGIFEPGNSRLLHRGSVALEWKPSAATRVAALQELARGRTDFSWLAGAGEAGVPSLDRFQQVREIAYQQSRSSVDVGQKVGRAVDLRLQADYTVSGGVDREDREAAPLVRVFGGGSTIAWKFDRSESFGIAARTAFARFADLGQRARTFDGGLQWEHRFGRGFRVLAGSGIGFAHSAGPSSRTTDSVAPTFALRLSRDPPARGRRLTYSIGARLAPFVSPVDASVSFRPEVVVDIHAPLAKKLVLRVTGAASRLANAGSGDTLVWGFSSGLVYAFTRAMSLSFGARAASQPETVGALFIGANLLRVGKL